MVDDTGRGAGSEGPAAPEEGMVGRLIFVVSRRDVERYDYLKRTFREEAKVDVVLDRRRRERRWREADRLPDDRRRGDRRKNDNSENLKSLGWALIRQI